MSRVEEWRPAVGFEGWYEVSDLGRVRRLRTRSRLNAPLVLAPFLCSGGYLMVTLRTDRGDKARLVHRLVAAAFIGEPPVGHEVNHLDGVKVHCASSNLEYATHSENMKHAYATGLHRTRNGSGNRVYGGKPTEYARLLADEARDAAEAQVVTP